MTNQGMYREAGVLPGGLPLPRARLWPLTIAIGATALVAMALSIALLGAIGGGAPGAWRLFRNGGWPMWLILLADLVGPIAIAVLGAFVVRGKRVPAGLLFVCAAVPFAIALLGAWVGQTIVASAISGESVDPEQKARILAQGIAESMSTDIFGGLVACGAAIAASLAASSAAASIDVATASRGGQAPPKLGALGAGVCGALWLVATLVVGALRMRSAGAIMLLPALPLLVIVPFAALAARGMGAVRGWHDRLEGSRVAGALLVGAVSAVFAMLALQRAIEASFASKALEAISGESIDPSQRLRILMEAVDAGRLAPASYAVHAVLGAATFGLALAPGLGGGKHPATPSAIVAVVLGLALLAGALAIGSFRESAPRAFSAAAGAATPAGVTLPVVVESLSEKRAGSGYGETVVITKDGAGGEQPSTTSSSSGRFTLYADKAATLAMVRARLPRNGSSRVTFVTMRDHPPDVVASLGYLAGYLGRIRYIAGTVDDDPVRGDPSETLRVVSVADDAIEIDGKRYTLPLPDSAEEGGSFRPKRAIHYELRPTDTVERAMRTVMGVEKLRESQIKTLDLERSFVIDDGTRPKRAAAESGAGTGIGLGALGGIGLGGTTGADGKSAPTLTAGVASVNGRLPPEVIQRIVRRNFGRVRYCYENGLRDNPKLAGRVTVKFVIDRSGAVTSAADAGSNLADQGVVSCIVRAFGNLSFPQPEGGIVTVVYPIDLR